MRFTLIIIISLLFNYSVLADLINPNPNIKPKEVVSIQLDSLKNNNFPYKDAGIEQTWNFAHPSNRLYTGPLSNFTKMMKSNSYNLMQNKGLINKSPLDIKPEESKEIIKKDAPWIIGCLVKMKDQGHHFANIEDTTSHKVLVETLYFQYNNNLNPSGIIDEKTRALLQC